jgi:NitT/TauT family transport system substrate-binding protein
MKRILVVTLLAASALVSAAKAQDVPTIRVGWTIPAEEAKYWMMRRPEKFPNLGKGYKIEWSQFQGTSPMSQALIAGALDCATQGVLPIAQGMASGTFQTYVVAQHVGEKPGSFSVYWAVKDDSPIKKVEDLKGKAVATNAAGSAVDVAMRAMLRKHGLEDKRDYTVIEAPFPAMRAMLAEKKVDLIPAVLPFSLDPEMQKISRALFTTKDAVGVTQFSVWMARKSFIDKNRAALVDFMEDTLRIVRWYLDPANKKEVMEICARVTKQPAERFDWVFTARDNYRDPNMLPNLDALQKNVDLVRDLGFVKSSIDIRKYSDLSVVQDAAKRLK